MTQRMIVSVPPAEVRLAWREFKDLPYSQAEILEIVQRYCDAQDHAKAYRMRAAEKVRVMKARLAELDGQ